MSLSSLLTSSLSYALGKGR